MPEPRKLKRTQAVRARPSKRPANVELLDALRSVQAAARDAGLTPEEVEFEIAARKAERLSSRR